jgi:hypothetical protein
MPADQGVTIDPGLHGGDPSDEELAKEDEARSETSVADLMEQDLDDPSTPSRRARDGSPRPGSFDVPLEDYRTGATDDR